MVTRLRRRLLLSCAILGIATAACAQEFGWFRGEPIVQNQPPPTEFIAVRWHFGTNGAIGHMGWAHNR